MALQCSGELSSGVIEDRYKQSLGRRHILVVDDAIS